jgi:cytochrome c oxidase subunit 3
MGILFAFSQFQGYQQLIDKGAYFVNRIMISNGRYGDYYEIKSGNDLLIVNGNQFLKKGEVLSDDEMQRLREFASLFVGKMKVSDIEYPDYGEEFSLIYRFEPLELRDGKFYREDSTTLELADWMRLEETMSNIAAGRGDFFISGDYGVDFELYYAGQALQYEDRQLFYDGKPLSRGLQLKLYDSKDNATAYLYIITFLHLLHILATLLYMFAFTRRIYANEFSEANTLGMRATAIFWHYLGALWLILLLFLLFIH